MALLVSLAGSVVAAADLVLPGSCAGCSAPDRRPVCAVCRDDVVAAVLPPVPVVPVPTPVGWPGCAATLRYEGVTARLVRECKDGDRRDLVPVLGRVLAESVRRAHDRAGPASGPVVLVPAPSARGTRRARGDAPVTEMARVAARRLTGAGGAGRVRVAPALRFARSVADQAGLGGLARQDNLRGAMALAPRVEVRGAVCVLVDDVVTSGATLAEGRRVLLAAGAGAVLLAAVAATPRRGPVLPANGGLT